MKKKIVIGIDLGGTGIRLAGIDSKGGIIFEKKEISLQSRSKDYVIDQIVTGIKESVSEYRSEVELMGLGIGVPGFIIEKGVIFSSPNFPEWNLVNLKKIIEERIGKQILLENDANAAAFGEFWTGAGKGSNNLIYLGLGTGVGGGIILDKKIWHGSSGVGGEIGHITVNPEGPVCGCGNYGCLETYASATGIVNNYLDQYRGERPFALTSKEIYLKAKQGDQAAITVFQDMGRYLGIGIASILNLLNPETVVIGGRVNAAWDLFADPMLEEIFKRGIKPSTKDVKIVPSLLLDRSGLIGAAGVVWDSFGLRED